MSVFNGVSIPSIMDSLTYDGTKFLVHIHRIVKVARGEKLSMREMPDTRVSPNIIIKNMLE